MSFERLFHPNAVAIIGASSDLTRIGGHPIKALKNAGYKGGLYLVNPKYQEMHGLKCYPDAMSIGKPCDLAIIAVPAPGVAQAMRDCGKAGIPFAVVLTAGFRETGAEGRKLEDELKRAVQGERRAHRRPQLPGHAVDPVARVGGVRQRGGRDGVPPGLGVVRLPVGRLRLCGRQPRRGAGRRLPRVRVVRQRDRHRHARAAVGVSRRCRHVAVFAYMEGTPNARRLLDVGRKSLETGKPVMIWKAGTTDAGIKAAASHTANMTGSYDLYRAALRQSGLIEVDDVEPIVDIAKLFAQGRLPKGNSVGVLSISGGSGDRLRGRGGARRPDAAAVLRRHPAGAAQDHARIRLAGESGRYHGWLLQRHAPVHRCAGGRAGRPGPRPALDPAGVDLRSIGGQGLPSHRRGRETHRQADPRGLVGPACEVAGGGEGPDRGGRARS